MTSGEFITEFKFDRYGARPGAMHVDEKQNLLFCPFYKEMKVLIQFLCDAHLLCVGVERFQWRTRSFVSDPVHRQLGRDDLWSDGWIALHCVILWRSGERVRSA